MQEGSERRIALNSMTANARSRFVDDNPGPGHGASQTSDGRKYDDACAPAYLSAWSPDVALTGVSGVLRVAQATVWL